MPASYSFCSYIYCDRLRVVWGGGGGGMEVFEVIQLWIPYVCGGYDHCVRIPTRTTQKLRLEKKGRTGRYQRGREQKNKKRSYLRILFPNGLNKFY
jgi:hypothetical protein